MGKQKKRGHFCKVCGRTRPNEKFSGKGHRQYICKKCKKNGDSVFQPSTSVYDRKVNNLNKAIKNGLIVHSNKLRFFLFEYNSVRYITRDNFESEIFVYQAHSDQKFWVDESLQTNEALMEVLIKKYYETLENGHTLDYDELIANEIQDVSKKRKQYLEVILSLKNIV